MASVATISTPIKTLADLVERLGGIPLDRIRLHPYPATIQDVIDIERKENRLCELVEGVLVEKVMGWNESSLAMFLVGLLNAFVISRNLGIVTGPDGTVKLMPDLVRIPDIAFTSWDRMPGRRRPGNPVPNLVPNLAVEVLSRSNTPGEMVIKRQEYFAAGVELVWEIDPASRTITEYTSSTDLNTLTIDDSLAGGTILPGFKLPVQQLFAELDRQG